jgi:hypothetical protein
MIMLTFLKLGIGPTPQAVVEAMNFIENRMKQLERSNDNNIASLTRYTAR